MQQGESRDIPELPKPWEPSETGDTASGSPSKGAIGSPGCGKFAALGCGCFGLGFGLLLIVGVAMSGRIVNWFLDTSREAIFEALPEEVTEEERRQLGQAFRHFSVAVEDGTLDTQQLTQLQLELTNAYTRAKSGVLEAVDVRRLIGAFDRALPQAGPTFNAPNETPSDNDSSDGKSGEGGSKVPNLERGSRSLPVAWVRLAQYPTATGRTS